MGAERGRMRERDKKKGVARVHMQGLKEQVVKLRTG